MPPHRSSFYFVLVLFFLSGFSALLYQVVWQRLLGCFAGVDVYSVTITVTAFMGGLGCGSLTGGYLADRATPGARILMFCAAEAVIAIFALLSKGLYYDLLYLKWSALGSFPAMLPAILFLSLLCPTFCMGVTLPILSKSFVDKIESAAAIVGYLYAANTLGAAAGAFTTTWILLRHLGFKDILTLGAILNATVAAGAVLVWLRLRARRIESLSAAEVSSPDSAEPARFSMLIWMLIYALSGFLALGLEIVWFRFFGILQKATAFTFGNLLSIYLFGLGLGAVAGVSIARRSHRPARLFLLVQAAITIYAGVTVTLFVWQLNRAPFFTALWTYLQAYDVISPADLLSHPESIGPENASYPELFRLLYFVVPMVLIAPATLLMGLSFPLLQRAVQVTPALVGRRVGWLQAMNIIGCMLGATLVGWGFFRWVGTAGALRLLVLLGGVFAFLFAVHSVRRLVPRLIVFGAIIFGLLSLVVKIPRQEDLWAKVHGASPHEILFSESDSGLSLLRGGLAQSQESTWVFTNGIGQSWIPYGSIHTQIGMLGAMLHPAPMEVAVIGLGSGDTLFALGGSPRTTQLTCIEIVRPEHATLSALARQKDCPALTSLLRDPRIQWHFTDGRAYLQRSGRLFDVIEADALRPDSSYSGFLYSHEYFQMIKEHLKPGGLAVNWAPTNRTLASFLHVFPHVLLINSVCVGSDGPIEINYAALLDRINDPFTRNYYDLIGADVRSLLRPMLTGKYISYLPTTPRSASTTDLNSDLFPRDEFGVNPP